VTNVGGANFGQNSTGMTATFTMRKARCPNSCARSANPRATCGGSG